MYNSIADLERAWSAVVENTREALNWLDRNRNSRYLENEYDSCCAGLAEQLEYAARMKDNCSKTNSVGIFGESQAGKSFLVSTLISDRSGGSPIRTGGKTLDFLRDINPQGSGKESTGVVTRFSSRCGNSAEPGFELVLLRELEIAKILINSYYNDLRDAKASLISRSDVNELVKQIRQSVPAGERSSSISVYDVVSLRQYVEKKYPFLRDSVLSDGYWQEAMNTVRCLPLEKRAEYFSCLWNRNRIFTGLYTALARELGNLGCPERVRVGVSAVAPSADGGSGSASIINVDALNGLSVEPDTQGPRVEVHCGGKKFSAALSSITALTAELVIPIDAADGGFGVIDRLDVLDFPGYRGRLNLLPRDLDESDGSMVKELYLRGKVSYLFERYTDLFEMNCLVVCTSSQSQINSVGMPEVVSEWIRNTQGEDPAVRSSDRNGLFWAITQFDKKIEDYINNPNMNFGENGLLQQTVLEKFGNCRWLQNWSDGIPFRNVYLVRKPGIRTSAVFSTGPQNETGIIPAVQPFLEKMKKGFVSDPVVQRYVSEPSAVWDEMLRLNDGGLKNLSRRIAQFPSEQKRIEFMNVQLGRVVENILTRLEYLYTDEDPAEIRKQKGRVLKSLLDLLKNRPNSGFVSQFGYFLSFLNLPPHRMYSLVEFSEPAAGSDAEASGAGASEPDDGGDFFDNLDELTGELDGLSATSQAEHGSCGRYIYSRWCEYVRSLAENRRLLGYFGITQAQFTAIANELLDCSRKVTPSLGEVLEKAVDGIIKKENRRDAAVIPVSSCSSRIISEFVSTFGGRISDLQNSNLDAGGLPVLSEQPRDQKFEFVKKWMTELFQFARDNLQAELKFEPEQNEKLGEILQRYRDLVPQSGD